MGTRPVWRCSSRPTRLLTWWMQTARGPEEGSALGSGSCLRWSSAATSPARRGDTALHCAAGMGHEGIVEMLLRKRASTDIHNKEGPGLRVARLCVWVVFLVTCTSLCQILDRSHISTTFLFGVTLCSFETLCHFPSLMESEPTLLHSMTHVCI